MRFVGDERAQSIQVGAVLLFAILIVFFAVWQAVVIPNQNEQVEFDHNQQVQSQLEQLRADMAALADSSTVRSSAIELGVRYPARLISLNPPAASGRLETVGTTNESIAAVIENATAAGETGDFWNGSERSFNTGAIVYEPRYNEYAQPPRTVLENGVLLNQFSNGRTIALTDQVVVDGDRIRIGALNGSLSLDRIDGASVDLQPVSTQTRTVAVSEPNQNTTRGNVTIELPTRLSQSDWEELVAGEQVHDVTVSGETVTIEMENLPEGESYDLQLWKVGVGTGATPTEAEYLTTVSGDTSTITRGETRAITVEARDEFNGPQRGVSVNASASAGNLTQNSSRTDADGQATFQYNSTGVSTGTTVTLNFSLTEAGNVATGSPQDVQLNLSVTAGGDGGDGGDGGTVNPTGPGGLVLESSAQANPSGGEIATLMFNNTDNNNNISISRIRVPFYFTDKKNGQATEVVNFDGTSVNASIGGQFVDVDPPVEFSPGEERDLEVEFNGDNNIKTGGDFFIILLEFTDGSQSTYYVAPS